MYSPAIRFRPINSKKTLLISLFELCINMDNTSSLFQVTALDMDNTSSLFQASINMDNTSSLFQASINMDNTSSLFQVTAFLALLLLRSRNVAKLHGC